MIALYPQAHGSYSAIDDKKEIWAWKLELTKTRRCLQKVTSSYLKRLDFMEHWIITIYIEILQKKIHLNVLTLF